MNIQKAKMNSDLLNLALSAKNTAENTNKIQLDEYKCKSIYNHILFTPGLGGQQIIATIIVINKMTRTAVIPKLCDLNLVHQIYNFYLEKCQ